jgi:hypothetical protein
MTSRERLDEIAYSLAIEIHEGRWNHVENIHRYPVPRCVEIMDEFRRRCPGFSLDEYQRAIADGLFASR